MNTPGMNYSLIQTHVLEFCLFFMTLLIFFLIIKFGVSEDFILRGKNLDQASCINLSYFEVVKLSLSSQSSRQNSRS
jgi:hypothetical protein